LIRGEDPLEIDTTVELMVALAVRSVAPTSGEVQCSGRVVRTVSPESGQSLPGSAVLIENYTCLPRVAGFVGAPAH
jgi:hypothetical protein